MERVACVLFGNLIGVSTEAICWRIAKMRARLQHLARLISVRVETGQVSELLGQHGLRTIQASELWILVQDEASKDELEDSLKAVNYEAVRVLCVSDVFRITANIH